MKPVSKKTGLCLVVAAGLLLSVPLILWGCPDSTHDGHDHLRWVEYFSRQFWNGEIYPRWLAPSNYGFGAPTFFYYAPLPYYVSAFFWRLAPSSGQAGLALGWASASALILSGVSALWCFRRFAKSEGVAVIGAIIYMAAPFHLAVDLLERGANAEFWGFIWPPLIIGAIEDITCVLGTDHAIPGDSVRKRLLCSNAAVWAVLKLSLALAGLFLTHVLSVIVFAPVVGGFALYRGSRTFTSLLIGGAIAIGLSAVYWFPLIVFRPFVCSARWEWFNGGWIALCQFFPTFEWNRPFIVLSPCPGHYEQLLQIFFGFAVVTVTAVAAAGCLSLSHRVFWNILFWAGALLGSLVMMLPISLPLYKWLPPLSYIQFSWRFMACATLAHCFLAVVILDASLQPKMREKLTRLRLLGGQLSGAVILLAAVDLALILGFANYDKCFFRKSALSILPVTIRDSSEWDASHVPVTADTVRNGALQLFPASSPEQRQPKLLGASGHVRGGSSTPRHWLMDVETTSPGKVTIPQFWFPGWKAKKLPSGEPLIVGCAPKSGLVQIEVPAGTCSVDVRLGALWPELAGDFITLTTACGVVLTGIHLRRRNQALARSIGE